MPKKRIFTIYDRMEENGVFESNPANMFAKDSEGRAIYKKAEFPMMVYHPKGEEKITNPGIEVEKPGGKVQVLGQKKELISQVVTTQAELDDLLALGWHTRPAAAIATREGRPIPLEPQDEIAFLKKQNAEMAAQLATNKTPAHSNSIFSKPTPAPLSE